MCGIVCIVSRTSTHIDALSDLTDTIRHRGPDAIGYYRNDAGTVGLGHTRLSVIDLSEAANQPFTSASGRYVVAFNGEIYNFGVVRRDLQQLGVSFKTHSDTEVIAEAFATWGLDMMPKLQGMFALIIYDTVNDQVHLLRDRMGKKPMFYFQSESLFICASEIKAILKHPGVHRSVNLQSLATFLHLGYIPQPHTIFQQVLKFPSGHVGHYQAGGSLKLSKYWAAEDFAKAARTSVADAEGTMNQLITGSVRERLISDVPVGSFLSGGIDSSLVTAYASRYSPHTLKTFSIGFDKSLFDETQSARDVARYLGTHHTDYILGEREAIDILDSYIQHYDEPFADTSAIPTMLVSKLARRDVTVALTGDGGDELFQGYGAYVWANRLAQPVWSILRSPLREAFLRSGKSRFLRVAQLLDRVPAANLRSHIFSQEQYLFSHHEIHNDLWRGEKWEGFAYDDLTGPGVTLTAGEQQALFDIKFYLKDDLLVKVDRASMYFALECRCPLLDHRIVEYALSLPANMKVRGNKRKWLLKKLLYKHLPAKLVDRPKWGFSIPLSKWLKGDLHYLLDSHLNKSTVEDVGLINFAEVQRLRQLFETGTEYVYNRLWVLVLLHRWMKENTP